MAQWNRQAPAWVRKHAPSNVEGVFIAGNGLRSIGVIAALGSFGQRRIPMISQELFQLYQY